MEYKRSGTSEPLETGVPRPFLLPQPPNLFPKIEIIIIDLGPFLEINLEVRHYVYISVSFV